MPPVLIDVRVADDVRDVIHRAVQVLAEGKLVVFPTETVYGVAAPALDAKAVQRLVTVKGRKQGHPVALAIRSLDEARDYAPDMSPVAQRLARRCWPGPVTLVVDNSHPESLVNRLPPAVRQVVSPNQTVGLRVPGHSIILDVLRMVAGPLVLSSANRGGEPEPRTADEALRALGDDVDLVLDDGPTRFGQPSSVVLVNGRDYKVLRAGAVPEKTLKRLTGLMVLFVCTGNTCRSPMAEGIFRSLVAKRWNCPIEELEDRGLTIMSAGIAAMMGGRATSEAVRTMSESGVDLSAHETQPLTEPLVRHADMIFTMTQSQREAILAQWPGVSERVHLLAVSGGDISDPIGGPLERYQRCAEQIRHELESRLKDLEL
jgi:tRNA threonylcarbamoyl adenosine modification protein (Sua5/YciO/YrdC/YwlC family)